MTTEILTQITLPAQPDEVWAILTDFAAYPDWNPFMIRIEGRCETGATLHVTLRMPDGKRHAFQPVIMDCTPGQRLAWKGTMGGMSWLFCGIHRFDLKPTTDGGTELTHRERFSGLLSAPLLALIRTNVQNSFNAMNHALHKRIQSTA